MIAFIVASTFITYNIHRYIGQSRIPSNLLPDRIIAIKEFQWPITGLLIIALITACYSLFQFSIEQIIYLIPIGVLTALYILPTIKRLRLRDLPFFKIFVLSSVWAYVFVVPFVFPIDNQLITTDIWVIGIEKFLFFLALTLPFDQRDVEVDTLTKVDTIPSYFGTVTTRYIIAFSIFLATLICVYLYSTEVYRIETTIALVSFYILLFPLTIYSEHKSDLYFLGVLDGMIFLNGLLYVIM